MDLRLRNENGTVVAIDPNTGEQIPVRVGPVAAEEGTIAHADWNDRPLWSTEDRTVDVPGEYPTIQAAVDDCPLYLRHDYTISVDDGTYDEDVLIRGVHDMGFSSTTGESFQLVLSGNRSDPSDVSVDTLTAVGCVGVETPKVEGISFEGNTPYDDESATVLASGCTEAHFIDCEFTGGAETAAEAYTAGMHVRSSDVGTENYSTFVFAKREGSVSTNSNAGTVTESPYRTHQNGSIDVQTLDQFVDTAAGDVDRFDPGNGVVHFGDAGPTYNRYAVHNYDGELQFRDRLGGQSYSFDDPVNGVHRFRVDGRGWGNEHIEDLSGQTGDFDGQIRLDDGTNTGNRGIPCTWDDVDGEWVPHDGSATFA